MWFKFIIYICISFRKPEFGNGIFSERFSHRKLEEVSFQWSGKANLKKNINYKNYAHRMNMLGNKVIL